MRIYIYIYVDTVWSVGRSQDVAVSSTNSWALRWKIGFGKIGMTHYATKDTLLQTNMNIGI